MSLIDLAGLQKEALETSRSKQFHSRLDKPAEAIALMHSELSEALESFRKNEPLLWFGEGGKPEGVAAEYADVVVRILLDCEERGINLSEAIRLKMDYNKTRPLRHGGRVF